MPAAGLRYRMISHRETGPSTTQMSHLTYSFHVVAPGLSTRTPPDESIQMTLPVGLALSADVKLSGALAMVIRVAHLPHYANGVMMLGFNVAFGG